MGDNLTAFQYLSEEIDVLKHASVVNANNGADTNDGIFFMMAMMLMVMILKILESPDRTSVNQWSCATDCKNRKQKQRNLLQR
ncbi:unnamed protein product [Gongylonema pulchrum]|uniref:Transmembrane protein n=1 Tax=Gongylonema pulchrum TaxID=637853 RepID=A0A183D7I9_9BILA|nr:unnamed protein product [Gongylonema pulchrum]